MKRSSLLFATVLLAAASTAVIATAHERGGPRGGDGMRGEMFLDRFDLDGDGQVTRSEIDNAAAARFTAADTNGDGVLSAEEMTAAAEARRAERRADRIERQIARIDQDGDGALSLEEITAHQRMSRAERMFDRLDADGDGVISAEEAEAAADGPRRGFRRGGRY